MAKYEGSLRRGKNTLQFIGQVRWRAYQHALLLLPRRPIQTLNPHLRHQGHGALQ